MDPQIESYLLQMLTIRQDLPGLASGLSPEQFNWRAEPGRWSVGQCIEHLSITTERYLPVLRERIAEARARGLTSRRPFTMGLIERVFFGILEPPVRMKAKAPAAFVGAPTLDRDVTLARWLSLHDALGECVRSAEGVDLGGIKVRSQFGPLSFTLGGTFSILLAHDRRHTWQARGVLNSPGFPQG